MLSHCTDVNAVLDSAPLAVATAAAAARAAANVPRLFVAPVLLLKSHPAELKRAYASGRGLSSRISKGNPSPEKLDCHLCMQKLWLPPWITKSFPAMAADMCVIL